MIGLICLIFGVFLMYIYNVSLVLIEGGFNGYGLYLSNYYIICICLINVLDFFGWGGGGFDISIELFYFLI